MLLASALLALPCAAQPQLALEIQWTNYQPFYDPGGRGMLVLDLEGDGQNEAIVSGQTSTSFGFNDHSFMATLRHRGGEFRQTHAHLLRPGQTFNGKLQALPVPPAAPGRIVASLFEENNIWLSSDDIHELVVFEGPGFRRIQEIALAKEFRLMGVADIDADGDYEVLGQSERYPQIRDLETGAVVWTGLERDQSLGAGQLDSDPALEIIVSGAEGTVLDGASGMVQWSYPNGFVGQPVVGDFDGNSETLEFLIIHPWGPTVLFTATPTFSPVSDFDTGQVQSFVVFDVDGNGSDELVFGSAQAGQLVIAYQPFDWTNPVFSHQQYESGVQGLAVGELDGDPAPEVIFGSGSTSTGPDLLEIFDSATNLSQFSEIDVRGPHSNLLVADIEQDGSPEIVYASIETGSGFRGHRISIADAATGQVLRERTLEWRAIGSTAGPQLVALQLDDDAALEIVVASATGYSSAVRVLDGSSLSDHWASADGANYGGPIDALSSMYFNGDDVPDVVTASGGRIIVWSGIDGTILWRSVPFGQARPDTNIAIANIDEDPALEIVVQNEAGLIAVDAASRLLEWQFVSEDPLIWLQIEGAGPACRLVVYEPRRLSRRHCGTRTVDTIRNYAVPNAQFVRPVTDSTGDLVFTDGERVMIQRLESILSSTEAFGVSLGFNNRGVVTRMHGQLNVFLGDSLAVRRLGPNAFYVFASGFEQN